jgi:hypothetical protein
VVVQLPAEVMAGVQAHGLPSLAAVELDPAEQLVDVELAGGQPAGLRVADDPADVGAAT